MILTDVALFFRSCDIFFKSLYQSKPNKTNVISNLFLSKIGFFVMILNIQQGVNIYSCSEVNHFEYQAPNVGDISLKT